MGYNETDHWSVYIDPQKKEYIYKVLRKFQMANPNQKRVDDFLVAAAQSLERDLDPRPRVL